MTIHTNSIGTMEALNITAIVGDKGQGHPYTCMDNSDGTNVLSVTFHPQQQILVSCTCTMVRLALSMIVVLYILYKLVCT